MWDQRHTFNCKFQSLKKRNKKMEIRIMNKAQEYEIQYVSEFRIQRDAEN